MFYVPEEIEAAFSKVVAAAIQPLHDEIKQLRFQLQVQESPVLSIKDFAKKAGLSVRTIRNYIDDGVISFNQKSDGCRITIPATELQKLKKL